MTMISINLECWNHYGTCNIVGGFLLTSILLPMQRTQERKLKKGCDERD